MVDDLAPEPDGPTPDELAAIEREMPLIRAEVALVDAEIRVLTAPHHPTDLDWRRLRRAEAYVLRAWAALLAVDPTFRPDLAA
jgi:Family of unknown function (DUF6284)